MAAIKDVFEGGESSSFSVIFNSTLRWRVLIALVQATYSNLFSSANCSFLLRYPKYSKTSFLSEANCSRDATMSEFWFVPWEISFHLNNGFSSFRVCLDNFGRKTWSNSSPFDLCMVMIITLFRSFFDAAVLFSVDEYSAVSYTHLTLPTNTPV